MRPALDSFSSQPGSARPGRKGGATVVVNIAPARTGRKPAQAAMLTSRREVKEKNDRAWSFPEFRADGEMEASWLRSQHDARRAFSFRAFVAFSVVYALL